VAAIVFMASLHSATGAAQDVLTPNAFETSLADPAPPTDPARALAPRLFALGISAGIGGRTFSYDANLQRESTAARPAGLAEIETFPLWRREGVLRGLGASFSLGGSAGHARLQQAPSSSIELPIVHDRWSFALRHAFAPLPRLLVVPTIGLGRSRYAIDGATQTQPSLCTNTSTDICLASVHLTNASVGAETRVAASRAVGLRAGAQFLAGLKLGDGPGELASEARTNTLGLEVNAGGSYSLGESFALTATLSWIMLRHRFSSASLSYQTATETYLSFLAGVRFTSTP
jgi:hypothetical protein